MSAKSIFFSLDGSSYLALPGNTGDLQVDGKQIDDTVFGQNFQSNQPGLIDWKATANGLYKGFAGYVANLYQPGSSTATTGEATTSAGAHSWQITNTAKRMLDRTVAVVVKDAGSDITATHVTAIDFLFGIVTLDSGYTPTGAITLDAHYFPLTVLGTAKTFTLKMSANMIDSTDLAIAQANGGFNTFQTGLITIELDLEGFYAAASNFQAALAARSELILGINPDGGGVTVARGFFKPSNRKQSGNVGALEDETMTFMLTVPVSSATTGENGVIVPSTVFSWAFGTGSTALQQVIQNILNNFLAGTLSYVKYTVDGTNGWKGQCVISDCSLKGGLDNMNEFDFTFQGSGALSVTP